MSVLSQFQIASSRFYHTGWHAIPFTLHVKNYLRTASNKSYCFRTKHSIRELGFPGTQNSKMSIRKILKIRRTCRLLHGKSRIFWLKCILDFKDPQIDKFLTNWDNYEVICIAYTALKSQRQILKFSTEFC